MTQLILTLIILLFLFRKKIRSIVKKEQFGILGEKEVASQLQKLPEGYKVVNHFTVFVNGKPSQIDHAVVSEYGLFVIETKNIGGEIYGNEKCWLLETVPEYNKKRISKSSKTKFLSLNRSRKTLKNQ